MSWTFVACFGIAFAWMALFYLWGKGFLTFIHLDIDAASCIPFGYMVLQVIYQIIYLPFYLSRGSYRAGSYIWIGIVLIVSVVLFILQRRQPEKRRQRNNVRENGGVCLTALLVSGLAVYIALHVPFYGADTYTYITTMNDAYYRDSMWITSGFLSTHQGLCSMFHFFTVSSLLTGIKPYYISLFAVRIVGVCLFAMILYRTGAIVFQKKKQTFCWPAAALSVLAPTLLMFWGSNYTAEFFYWRINEAKGFCQFVLMPLGFSVFLEMFKDNVARKSLWKEQYIIGLAAIPVSSSSLTPYIFLVFLGTCALLVYDKFKGACITLRSAFVCVIPNLIYLVFYVLAQKQIIAL